MKLHKDDLKYLHVLRRLHLLIHRPDMVTFQNSAWSTGKN